MKSRSPRNPEGYPRIVGELKGLGIVDGNGAIAWTFMRGSGRH